VSTATGAGGVAQRAQGAAREAADSRPVDWAARAGLTARGVVYLLVGGLALLVAFGGHQHVDQKGALQQVLAKPFGGFLVAAMAVGFAAYALWRFSEAAFGVTGEGHGALPRIQSLVRGLVYAGLAVVAVTLLLGSRKPQSSQSQEITARVMSHPGGQWLVGIVGAAIAVTGLVLAWQGVRATFMKYFPQGQLSQPVRTAALVLGRIGNVGRGLVFALAGGLVVAAAVTYDPSKAGGLDVALKTLRDRPYGGWLLGLAAFGLIAFGVYGLIEARYRRV
jgi:uncharacterized integral membrane protein